MNSAALELQRAQELISANPSAFAYLFGIADKEVRAERHFSFRWVVEQFRKKHWVAADGSDLFISNNLIPALARIYANDNPTARNFITFKSSKFDEVIANGEKESYR